MKERVVYLNGEYIEESKARISIYDRGFLFGDAVYEAGRTFGHKPYKLSEHIDRLFRSLQCACIDPRLSAQEICDITLEVIKQNIESLDAADELGYFQRVSRGESLYMSDFETAEPTVLIYCLPIDFRAFARKYREGIHLIMARTRRIPPACLDPRVKTQSRIVNVLADLEVKAVDPSAYALMLDIDGFLSEGPSFNFFTVAEKTLFTPKPTNALEGITKKTILEMAEELAIETCETDLTPYDLTNADEIFITATSFEILPVSKLNHKSLKRPIPGPITKKLLSELSMRVGIDLGAQAQSHLDI